MKEWIITIYAALLFIDFFANVKMVVDKELFDTACTPHEFYDKTNLNLFGCALLTLLVFVLDPWLLLFRFIYWIFHVGRKK